MVYILLIIVLLCANAYSMDVQKSIPAVRKVEAVVSTVQSQTSSHGIASSVSFVHVLDRARKLVELPDCYSKHDLSTCRIEMQKLVSALQFLTQFFNRIPHTQQRQWGTFGVSEFLDTVESSRNSGGMDGSAIAQFVEKFCGSIKRIVEEFKKSSQSSSQREIQPVLGERSPMVPSYKPALPPKGAPRDSLNKNQAPKRDVSTPSVSAASDRQALLAASLAGSMPGQMQGSPGLAHDSFTQQVILPSSNTAEAGTRASNMVPMLSMSNGSKVSAVSPGAVLQGSSQSQDFSRYAQSNGAASYQSVQPVQATRSAQPIANGAGYPGGMGTVSAATAQTSTSQVPGFSYSIRPPYSPAFGAGSTPQSSTIFNQQGSITTTPNSAPNSTYLTTPGIESAINNDGAGVVITQQVPSSINPDAAPNSAYISTPGLGNAANQGAVFNTQQVNNDGPGMVPNSSYYTAPSAQALANTSQQTVDTSAPQEGPNPSSSQDTQNSGVTTMSFPPQSTDTAAQNAGVTTMSFPPQSTDTATPTSVPVVTFPGPSSNGSQQAPNTSSPQDTQNSTDQGPPSLNNVQDSYPNNTITVPVDANDPYGQQEVITVPTTNTGTPSPQVSPNQTSSSSDQAPTSQMIQPSGSTNTQASYTQNTSSYISSYPSYSSSSYSQNNAYSSQNTAGSLGNSLMQAGVSLGQQVANTGLSGYPGSDYSSYPGADYSGQTNNGGTNSSSFDAFSGKQDSYANDTSSQDPYAQKQDSYDSPQYEQSYGQANDQQELNDNYAQEVAAEQSNNLGLEDNYAQEIAADQGNDQALQDDYAADMAQEQQFLADQGINQQDIAAEQQEVNQVLADYGDAGYDYGGFDEGGVYDDYGDFDTGGFEEGGW